MFGSVICEKCNEKMPKKANYCMNCGSPVGKKLEEVRAKELEEQERIRQQEEAEKAQLEQEKLQRERYVQRMNKVGNSVMKAQLEYEMSDHGQMQMPGAGGDFFGQMDFHQMQQMQMESSLLSGKNQAREVAKGRNSQMSDQARAANEARMMRQMEAMSQRRQPQPMQNPFAQNE